MSKELTLNEHKILESMCANANRTDEKNQYCPQWVEEHYSISFSEMEEAILSLALAGNIGADDHNFPAELGGVQTSLHYPMRVTGIWLKSKGVRRELEFC